MSLRIDYDKLEISWVYWKDVPLINQLTDEMEARNHKWWYKNWKEYLIRYYGLNISVKFVRKFKNGKVLDGIQFQNKLEMELFILTFM